MLWNERGIADLAFILFQKQPESCRLGGEDSLLQAAWLGVVSIGFKALTGTVKQQYSHLV